MRRSKEAIRLIVSGDDFGASEEVNEGIERAFREGILRACSLMVAGDACGHAVEIARRNPGLTVGLHIVTVMGRSVLPHSEIPAIVDREGRFPDDPARAGLRYFFSPMARREIRREIAAQFERFRSTGLRLAHVDSHLHMHVHPVIFEAALAQAERLGTKRMRVPTGDFREAIRFDHTDFFKKFVYASVFRLLSARMRGELDRRGFVRPDRVFGNIYSGRMSEEYVLFILERLRGGINEIYFHPAARGRSPQGVQCARELDILTSPRVLERVRARGIVPTDYPGVEG